MVDETLQAAFEIKTACDEISRKLLRWHWEQKPGAHSLDALLKHLAQRQKESPDYYDRMPDLSGKTSWQQLDTTLCMRVLLDPEKDAAKPLDLLGNTPHPSAARRACNAVRTARNEAAHAADRADGTQAAILFNEAIESLEEGYAGTAFKTSELEQYYRMAEDFLSRCGAKKPLASARAEEEGPRASTRNRNGTKPEPRQRKFPQRKCPPHKQRAECGPGQWLPQPRQRPQKAAPGALQPQNGRGAGGGGGAGPGGPGCQYGPVCKIMQEKQRTERTFPDGEALPVLFMRPGHTMASEPKREGGSRKGQGFYHCLAGWRCFCLEWTG